MKKIRIATLCLGVILAAPLAGCVVEEHRPPPPPAAAVLYVPKAPPAPIAEVQPAPPGPPEEFFWKPGHWRWNGAEYVWHHGVWERRPPKAVEWIPPHWENRPGGWVFVEGHYRY
jgi:hypothetical protein